MEDTDPIDDMLELYHCAVEKLQRDWSNFFAGAFTAIDDEGNQLPRDEQPCRGLSMTIDEANRTHDWNKHIDLPLCKICGMSKISARIWGDDDWTKHPLPCPGRPEGSEESK